MPASATEAKLIRFNTGRTESQLGQAILDMLYDKAETQYAAYSRDVVSQAVLVEVYRNLVATHRQDVNYKQNETSENLSDIAKGYAQDLEAAKAELNEMIESEGVSAYIVSTRRIPSNRKDTPW